MTLDLAAELEVIRERNEWAMALAELKAAADRLHRYTFVEHSFTRYAEPVSAAVRYFSADLGIVEPDLRFFVPETCAENGYARTYGARDWESFGYHAPILGLCSRTRQAKRASVYVRADLPDEWDAIAVTLHELRHAAQPIDMPTADAESDADDYARRKVGRAPSDRRNHR